MLLRRVCGLSRNFVRFSAASAASSSLPAAPSEGVWAEVKTLTAQLAAAPAAHADESFKRLEHVGYARLSAAAEQTADGQKAERFPLNADHVRAAIRTVLASRTLDDPVGAAWRLAAFLVDLQLTKLDDEWILELIRADLQRNASKPELTLDLYAEITRLHPHLKIFPASIFEIMSTLHRTKGKKRAYEKGLKLIEEQGGRVPRHCINGAVLLAEGRALDFFDALKNDGRTFGVDELRYVCSLAAAVKEPKILEPLVQMHQMLPSNHSALLELFNTLAMLYGKRGDLDGIDVLWRSLRKQIKPKDHARYEHVFQRCRHFYRCNNRKIPEELTEFLPKTSKF